MNPKQRLHNALAAAFYAERRVDPYFRDAFNGVLQQPLVDIVQTFINARRPDEHLALCEERIGPDEGAIADEITSLFATWLHQHYRPGQAQRAGNTKTYGVVRAIFEVLPGLAPRFRQGVFAEPRAFPAWVRFSGPGPLAPPDIDDNGILGVGIKLTGVDGPKLLDDERFTQDFTGLSAPPFTTPNIRENVKLHRQLLAGTPLFYWVNPFDSHLLDGLMQALYSRTQTSPLEVRYWSCVPYLFGEGQAIQYSLIPRSGKRTPIPRDFPADYLRAAMAKTLSEQDVHFDFTVQLQTDPQKMPIENASVVWPERLSPHVPVARLRIPAQRFDSPAQLAFAGNLAYNPWHSIAAHRPLGSLNRARRHMYLALSGARQAMNGEPHLEPTGDETFDA